MGEGQKLFTCENSEQNLFAGIIRQAIDDAVSVKRPRQYHRVKPTRKFIMRQYNILKKLELLLCSSKKPSTIIYIKKEILIINRNIRIMRNTLEQEFISLDARRFLKASNKGFKLYCELIGYDEEWVERKAWEIIYEEDKKRNLAPYQRRAKIKASLDRARKETSVV